MLEIQGSILSPPQKKGLQVQPLLLGEGTVIWNSAVSCDWFVLWSAANTACGLKLCESFNFVNFVRGANAQNQILTKLYILYQKEQCMFWMCNSK